MCWSRKSSIGKASISELLCVKSNRTYAVIKTLSRIGKVIEFKLHGEIWQKALVVSFVDTSIVIFSFVMFSLPLIPITKMIKTSSTFFFL